MADDTQPFERIVRDGGQLFRRGEIVRLYHNPSGDPPWRIVVDRRGDHEVLACRRLNTLQAPSHPRRLRVTLRAIQW